MLGVSGLVEQEYRRKRTIILLWTSMDCCVWNVLPISNGCNKIGGDPGMGCEDGDQRERKNLPCTEWVNRGKLYSGKGMIKQECDKH